MRYSYAAISMIIVGMMAFVILMVFQDVTINNEADYYSIKEAMEASMVESIDKSYYARTGELKIVEEKFVANFTRRFANNTMGSSKSYIIDFYDIMESPPKASVVIRNDTDLMIVDENSTDIVNNLTGILEATVDSSSYDKTVCSGKIKTGTLDITGYYSNLWKGSSSSYKLNSDYVLDKIKSKNKELTENNILNLRIYKIENIIIKNEEVTGINLLDTYKFSGSYKNDSWTQNYLSNNAIKKGYESNECYISNAVVRIIDATGENYPTIDATGKKHNYPVVNVETSVTDVSSNGCKKDGDGFGPPSLINYTVVWKYDYCD